jgi:transposase
MVSLENCDIILALHKSGESARSIARKMSLSRGTVGKVINGLPQMPVPFKENQSLIPEEKLREYHAMCGGWMQRMHEKLNDEEGLSISYSTLTKRCRELGLSKRQQSKTKRFHHVETEPGEEMQHDTSPYKVMLGDVLTPVVASVIYLRYSKRIYLKFYLSFKRYHMKCFFHEALTFFGYSARTCIIDNTNLARHSGAGYSALISPEMDVFSRRYGFEFICHEIKHSNRKAGNERAFWTVETNFLPGRTFKNLDDMNEQGIEWATIRQFQRPHSKTRLIPAETFEIEKPYLNPVLETMPAPTQPHHRLIDRYGFINFEANSYWIPGTDRFEVKIIESPTSLRMTRSMETLIEYNKPSQDVRGVEFKPQGLNSQPRPKILRKTSEQEQNILNSKGGSVPDYILFILSEAKGVRKTNFIRSLHAFSKQVSDELFGKVIERALRYRIVDIDTIESIATRTLGLSPLPRIDTSFDPDLNSRLAYRDGSISEEPDLEKYNNIPEEDEPC